MRASLHRAFYLDYQVNVIALVEILYNLFCFVYSSFLPTVQNFKPRVFTGSGVITLKYF